MTTWFTADLHLGHRNINSYCGRPFDDAEAMNHSLVDGWNGLVPDHDDVWVLGDFALGKLADTLPLVSELRGRTVLLAGNHDRCWIGHGRRAVGWTERYLDAGFDDVHQGEFKYRVGRTEVLLCHFPYRGDSHDHDRYREHRPADRGSWLLHGPVRERWAQRGRMINVGVDAIGFRPISESEVAAIIERGVASCDCWRFGWCSRTRKRPPQVGKHPLIEGPGALAPSTASATNLASAVGGVV